MITRIIAYATVYIVWGSTYLFIKLGIQHIPSFTLMWSRFLTGTGILLALAWAFGQTRKMPSVRQIRNSMITGFLLLLGGNGLVVLAEKKVDSYIAALIVSTVPIAVLGYDVLLFRKRPPVSAWIGAVLGVCGVGVLLIQKPGFLPSLSLHILLMIGAVVFWALGTSLSKVLVLPQSSLVNGSIQFLSAGFICLILSIVAGESPRSIWTSPPLSLWSLIYLAVVGSLALAAYYWLLYNEPNHRLVSYALINPLVAVYLGLFIAREASVPYILPGTGLILAGLFLMLYGERILGVLRRA